MQLLIVSLLIWLYVTGRFMRLVPMPLFAKIGLGLVLFAVSLKFVFYRLIGGSLFAPDLPGWILLIMEAAYAALLLLFVLLIIRDAAALVAWVGRCLGMSWRIPVSRATQVLCLGGIALVAGCWGTWQSVRVPDVRTVDIVLSDLPRQLEGFTIVQISDIHIGHLLQKEWLQNVVERINRLHPDSVVLTGDYIDGPVSVLGKELEPLKDVRSVYGVYGVTGNHEYYYGAGPWIRHLQKLGVRMLCNEHEVIQVNGALLTIAGIPDRAAARFGEEEPDLDKALAGAPASVRVLLVHHPAGAAGHQDVDIQLSGHTHGGALFFLRPLIASYNDGFIRGLYTLGRLQLYVSSGTGIWGGFSCRLGVPSEITRIVLHATPDRS